MTYLGQKFCMVVYPGVTSSEPSGDEAGQELKEAMSPLSKEDREDLKANC